MPTTLTTAQVAALEAALTAKHGRFALRAEIIELLVKFWSGRGETAAISVVRVLPPRESCKSLVSLESR